MTMQIATADDVFRARNLTEDEVDGPTYIPVYLPQNVRIDINV